MVSLPDPVHHTLPFLEGEESPGLLLIGQTRTWHIPPEVGALYAERGEIRELGAPEELKARHPGARRIYAERITPGLADAHTHPLFWGAALEELDLTGLSFEAILERLSQEASRRPPGSWIVGRGMMGVYDRRALDERIKEHPVLLWSRDHHAALVNQRALEQAGIGQGTPDPPRGRISRWASGEPDGYVQEAAVELVASHLPPLGPSQLARGLSDFARRGYTAIHALGFEPLETLAWAEAMELPVRVWWAVPAQGWRSVEAGWRNSRLEVRGVKFFADGALGSRTAWMHRPYPDGSLGLPLDAGPWIRHEGEAALERGFTLAVHAIGTRAVEEVLGIFAELAPQARRPLRIEHVQHVRDEDLPRFAGLPLALSMQPLHLEGDAPWIRAFWGEAGLKEAYRFRDLWSTGLPLAFGSDAPVAAPEWARNLACATHPLLADQALSPEEVLWAHTRGAALAAGWSEYGHIAPGAPADLTLWEEGRPVARVFAGHLEAL